MKRINFFWLLGLIFLLGCNKDSLLDQTIQPSEEGVVSLRSAFVPFKGDETTVSVSRTDVGNIRTIIFEGGGNATHLGKFTSRFTQIVDLTTPSLFTGSAILTAANNDQLFYDYEGSIVIDFPNLSFTGEIGFTFTGGTGRFVDAEGSGTAISTGVFPDFPPDPDEALTIDITYEGKISY